MSDPGEARGNTVTAREVLDRGAAQVDTELRDEPAVRADLMTTLAEVYTSLGLYRSGAELVNKARGIPGQTDGAGARQAIALAEMEVLLGNYERADQLYLEALALERRAVPPDPMQLARALIGRGEVLSSLEQEPAALVSTREGLDTARRVAGADSLVARGTEGMAYSHLMAGDLDIAEQEYRQALDLRIRISGEFHPKVSETLNSLGAIAYMRGDNALAEAFYERALPIDRKVLGDNHPDVAATMNNLARVYLEQRKFPEAEALLRDSRSAMLAEKSVTHDDMAFVFGNLGLVAMARGDFPAARQELGQALEAAVAHHHRLHGPILTDLADLDCRTGHYADGLAQLAAARPIVAERYAQDAWRIALIDSIQASCLAGAGRMQEALASIGPSTDRLLERWDPASLYGHDAIDRALAVYKRADDRPMLARYARLAQRD